MEYRDERETLRARVEELEGELETAEQTIARLRGQAARPPIDQEVDWVTGVPKQLRLERQLPFEISDEGYEAIADLLNRRLPGGNLSQVGRTLTHRRASYELRLSRTGKGRTLLEIDADYRPARAQLLLGSPGLALITGGMSGGALAGLGLSVAFPAVLVPLVVLATILGFRSLLKRGMDKERKMLTGLFEAVADLAKEHRMSARRRIATPAGAAAVDEEALAEQQALAEQEELLAPEQQERRDSRT